MIIKNLLLGTSFAMLLASTSIATVLPEVVDRLGKDLTPMGSQKAGNKEGTIPAWTGGLQGPPSNVTYKIGDRQPDPYPDDKILFTITAANMAQYAKNLGEMPVAMLKAYPDSFKMNVYQTRRSCAQPPAMYEQMKINALNSTISPDAAGLTGALRTIAFPIPGVAQEVIWDHRMKFRGHKVTLNSVNAAPTRTGDFTLYVSQAEAIFSYIDPAVKSFDELNNIWYRYIQQTIAPARSAGNVVLIHDTINLAQGARKAWVYSPGTRRVRRSPNIAYDNPGTNSDGLQVTDGYAGFNGAMDRYDWTYIGRSEFYLAANSYRMAQTSVKYKDIFKPGHINMDLPRYELARGHVIEAKVRPETRHIYAKRKFWLEEDGWFITQTSAYDTRGQLWRVQEQYGQNFYEVPLCDRVGAVVYDLNAGRYLVDSFINEEPSSNYNADELEEKRYTPDAIRQLGVR